MSQKDTKNDAFQLHRRGTASTPTPLALRQQQWQEALQSLYAKFLAVTEKDDDTMYFCSVDSHHTLLFRWKQGEPQITLSNCGRQFRDQLRERNVNLWTTTSKSNSAAIPFTEAMLDTSPTKSTSMMMSPTTKSELTALRRAHAKGETVGADIQVHTSSATATSTFSTPVLWVRGHTDCQALHDVYRERCGNVFAVSTDVPTLACRHLGPFRHGVLEQWEWKGDGHFDMLLPCAVRQVQQLAASAASSWWLQAHGPERQLMVAWDSQRPQTLACKISDNSNGY